MLNYLKNTKAEYENSIERDKEVIKECQNTITAKEESIKASKEKIAFIDELIAKAPADEAKRVESVEADVEVEVAEEETPAETPMVIQYSKKV